MIPPFLASLGAKAVATILAVLAAAGLIWALVWFVFGRPHAAKVQAAQATASSLQAQAATQAAQDALKITVDNQAVHGRIDVVTQGNLDAIRNAQGANAAVDPVVHAAGISALCMYDAYRNSDACKQLLNTDTQHPQD